MSDDLRVPSLATTSTAIDNLGSFMSAVQQYLQTMDTIEKKLSVAEAAYAKIESSVTSIIMIPGSGGFVYDTVPTWLYSYVSGYQTLNTVSQLADGARSMLERPKEPTDVVLSLDDLQKQIPGIKNVALVASWFATDLRAGHCQIMPGSDIKFENAGFEFVDAPYEPSTWVVAGQNTLTAHQITIQEPVHEKRAYGSTPNDAGVVRCIREMSRRGLKTTFYPFILVDVPADSGLPDPFGGTQQPQYPWRGRITCYPAPGIDGTPDGTAEAAQQVRSLIGTAMPSDFVSDPVNLTVHYTGQPEWSFRRFILHYAHLCAIAGGVETFLLCSELRGLTWVRDEAGEHPFVDALAALAADVKLILPNAKIVYGADWTEFKPYQVPGGGLHFHLDSLWSSPSIDAVGIDCYWPLADWRGVVGLDEETWTSIYDPAYLATYIESGEGYDWYYASDDARIAQVRSSITDGTHGKPWVYRYKDIRNWWSNQHFNRRADGSEVGTPTSWVPKSKPIWFTEVGCPAIDKGANQPNVFVDPKSSESTPPYFSTTQRDDLMQTRYIAAMLSWYSDSSRNPKSDRYPGQMVDAERMYVYCWDARPYPYFPDRSDVWGDAGNWYVGHWVSGRAPAIPSSTSVDSGSVVDLMPVRPMPKGEPAVDPKTGELTVGWHHYISQIETIARRLSNLQITAIASK